MNKCTNLSLVELQNHVSLLKHGSCRTKRKLKLFYSIHDCLPNLDRSLAYKYFSSCTNLPSKLLAVETLILSPLNFRFVSQTWEAFRNRKTVQAFVKKYRSSRTEFKNIFVLKAQLKVVVNLLNLVDCVDITNKIHLRFWWSFAVN